MVKVTEVADGIFHIEGETKTPDTRDYMVSYLVRGQRAAALIETGPTNHGPLIEDGLRQFVKEYADDQYCLEILHFFGGYPNTRFSWLAIVHVLNVGGGRLYIERALKHLVNKGVIRTHAGSKLPLYSLTDDASLRSRVLELAKLNWHRWQLVLQQTGAASDEASANVQTEGNSELCRS